VRQRFAESNVTLARQCQANNQWPDARSAIEAALVTLRDLEKDKPDDQVTKLKIIQAQVAQQTILRVLEDEEAADTADAVVKAAKDMAAKMPQNPDANIYAANALIERALLKITRKSYKTARADLDTAWPFVQAAATGGKDTVVVISADANAPHQSVITVMEGARRAGLMQITFATQSAAQAGR
jgi:hypothetical protein